MIYTYKKKNHETKYASRSLKDLLVFMNDCCKEYSNEEFERVLRAVFPYMMCHECKSEFQVASCNSTIVIDDPLAKDERKKEFLESVEKMIERRELKAENEKLKERIKILQEDCDETIQKVTTIYRKENSKLKEEVEDFEEKFTAACAANNSWIEANYLLHEQINELKEKLEDVEEENEKYLNIVNNIEKYVRSIPNVVASGIYGSINDILCGRKEMKDGKLVDKKYL